LGLKLNTAGGFIKLLSFSGKNSYMLDSIIYPKITGEHSFGRWPDRTGDFTILDNPTPGDPNDKPYIMKVENTSVKSETIFIRYDKILGNLLVELPDASMLPAQISLIGITGITYSGFPIINARQQISIPHLTAGIYFVKLVNQQKVFTQKIYIH
jgi:hypothetical protein